MTKIFVLHGPNLNLLGQRENNIYGTSTLEDINQTLASQAKEKKVEIYFDQSNSESHLIDLITTAKAQNVNMLIFNPAAFTHTSIALRDTLLAVNIPFIEVHLSNIFARESFRHHSYFSDIAVGTISGFGTISYTLALEAAIQILRQGDRN